MLKTKNSILNLTIDGKNNSETVILLHGGPGVPDYMAEISKFLESKYRVVRFDQRGVGESECLNKKYNIEQYLTDIDEILNYLKVDKVHILGHSWGGLLAQLWASRNPEKLHTLFLCSPSSGTGEVWKQMEKEVMAYNKNKSSQKEWMKIGLNSLFGILGSNYGYRNIFRLLWSYYFKEPKIAPPAGEQWLSGISAQAINKTRKNIISLNNNALDEALESFNKPVSAVFGSYDIYGESKMLIKKRFTNLNYTILEKSGHLPWLQNAEAFSKILSKHYGKLLK